MTTRGVADLHQGEYFEVGTEKRERERERERERKKVPTQSATHDACLLCVCYLLPLITQKSFYFGGDAGALKNPVLLLNLCSSSPPPSPPGLVALEKLFLTTVQLVSSL